ncbi:unnamed protein product [Dovyalis caffra]|uniref:Uncharacterized protein n=1 Tax=Dovyalis caffra TaxID=77055 RepID=A0AAV1SEI7_9ROSI|nr:unnamed protein product [Dovyalis caffra]
MPRPVRDCMLDSAASSVAHRSHKIIAASTSDSRISAIPITIPSISVSIIGAEKDPTSIMVMAIDSTVHSAIRQLKDEKMTLNVN